MEQNSFAQTMPHFRARPYSRAQVSSATVPRRQPAFLAVGSACHSQRFAACPGRVPSAPPMTASHELIHGRGGCAGQYTTFPRFQEMREPLPHTHKSVVRPASSGRGAKLRQLLWEEQVARLELQYKEQERRVDLALSKPGHQALRSSPRFDEGSQRAPQGRRKLHLYSPAEKKAPASSPSCFASPNPSAALFYVRDSELLRALQRAEARVRELELRSAFSQHTGAEPQTSQSTNCAQMRSIAGTAPEEISAKNGAFGDPDEKRCAEEMGYTPFCTQLVVL